MEEYRPAVGCLATDIPAVDTPPMYYLVFILLSFSEVMTYQPTLACTSLFMTSENPLSKQQQKKEKNVGPLFNHTFANTW